MNELNEVNFPKNLTWVDLTHDLSENIPTWTAANGFQKTDIVKYEDCLGECKFLVQKVEMQAGIGTHIDAPKHCFSNGKTIDEIPLQTLISPCFVMDVSKEADEDYVMEISTIKKFENEHGKISKSTFVIVYTGWDKFWTKKEKYHNNYRFPSVSKQAAEYLVSKDISGLGIDTLSPDRPESGFPVHQIVLGADKYIVENIANAKSMPATGGFSFILPIRFKGGSEAPIRLLGCF